MKPIALILFGLLFFSCSEDNTDLNPEVQDSKVLLLKVDFTTEAFEGGLEIDIEEPVQDFNIISSYQPPGDFGGIQLYSANSNTLLFDGTIYWSGLGAMQYPEFFNTVDNFETIENIIELPNGDLFKKVIYSEFETYPETMEISNIWSAVNNLAIVKSYRNSNPESSIQLFLYTPSVGIGNPEDWDWIVFMKN